MASRSQQARQREAAVLRWNKANPIGAEVMVLTDNEGTLFYTTTRSVAWISKSRAVILVDGRPEPFELARVRIAEGKTHKVFVVVDGEAMGPMYAAGDTAQAASISIRNQWLRLCPGKNVMVGAVAHG